MARRVPLPLMIGLGFLALALLHIAGFLRPIEDMIRVVLLPGVRSAATVGAAIDQPEAKTLQTLEDENRELRSHLTSVTVDYVKLRALEEENRSLRELASFLKESGYDRVGARVIARSTDPRSATILIDRGAKDGLELGQAVVADEGFFVGKIISLTDRVATVQLASDPGSRVAAAKAGERKLIGLVQGEGNGVARLSLVPQTVELIRDDVIVTAGTEEKIPPNLVIALVNEPEGKETDPFKTASLEPVLQSGQLDLVVVLRPTALRPGESL